MQMKDVWTVPDYPRGVSYFPLEGLTDEVDRFGGLNPWSVGVLLQGDGSTKPSKMPDGSLRPAFRDAQYKALHRLSGALECIFGCRLRRLGLGQVAGRSVPGSLGFVAPGQYFERVKYNLESFHDEDLFHLEDLKSGR